MKRDNPNSLGEFESDFSDIELVEPSGTYLKKGRNILEDLHSVAPIRSWHSYPGNIFAVSASFIVVLGIAIGITSAGRDFRANLKTVDTTHFDERKILAHQFVSSPDVQIIQSDSNQTAGVTSQESIVEGFLIANCQDCHESKFLMDLIPENIDGAPAEVSRLMKQKIVELIANTES